MTHPASCACADCVQARRQLRRQAYDHLRGEDSGAVDGYTYAEFNIQGPADIEKLFWELTERVKVGNKFSVRVMQNEA